MIRSTTRPATCLTCLAAGLVVCLVADTGSVRGQQKPAVPAASPPAAAKPAPAAPTVAAEPEAGPSQASGPAGPSQASRG